MAAFPLLIGLASFFSLEHVRAAHETDVAYNYSQALIKCQKANSAQLYQVVKGGRKRSEFLDNCARETNNSPWCQQLVRPNPASIAMFRCTYGNALPHELINPDEKVWKDAYTAVELIDELARKGIPVCEIYNWWRPEPYNKNVGGAPGRHPSATSIDVRFCSAADAIRGFDALCKYRKRGIVRALGYYGNSGVHIGVGDGTANTWGRNCK